MNLKLIREYDPQVIVESKKDPGSKKWFVKGVTLQSETLNGNRRIYPKKVLQESIEKYMSEYEGRAVGELNHPTANSNEIDPKEISHKFVEVVESGNNFETKALILDTPNGKIVQNLLEGEVKLGISSRGLGQIKESNGEKIVTMFKLITLGDIVINPSAPDAFLQGILESKEWIYENGVLIEKDLSEEIETYQSIIKKSNNKDINIVMKKIIEDYSKKLFG